MFVVLIILRLHCLSMLLLLITKPCVPNDEISHAERTLLLYSLLDTNSTKGQKKPPVLICLSEKRSIKTLKLLLWWYGLYDAVSCFHSYHCNYQIRKCQMVKSMQDHGYDRRTQNWFKICRG